jgi:chemotaxis protein CheX
MKYEVALIDFPRLQDQILAGILKTFPIHPQSLSHQAAAEKMSMFDLVIYFWPDAVGDAPKRVEKLKIGAAEKKVPIMLVASVNGRHAIESAFSQEHPFHILTLPLEPVYVSRKVQSLLDIREANEPLTLDVAYINPFVNATVETLKQMANMDCERTGLSARLDAQTKGYVSGVMGLTGAATGFASTTFGNELARKIVSRMLQIRPEEINEADIRDAVGEIMNIIAGRAKADLAATEHAYQLSPPNVIVGGPHSVGQVRGTPVIVIEFTTEGESFEVMVSLVPRRKPA